MTNFSVTQRIKLLLLGNKTTHIAFAWRSEALVHSPSRNVIHIKILILGNTIFHIKQIVTTAFETQKNDIKVPFIESIWRVCYRLLFIFIYLFVLFVTFDLILLKSGLCICIFMACSVTNTSYWHSVSLMSFTKNKDFQWGDSPPINENPFTQPHFIPKPVWLFFFCTTKK